MCLFHYLLLYRGRVLRQSEKLSYALLNRLIHYLNIVVKMDLTISLNIKIISEQDPLQKYIHLSIFFIFLHCRII